MPTSSFARIAMVLALGLAASASPTLLTQLASGAQAPAAAAPDRVNQAPGGAPVTAGTTAVPPTVTFVDTASSALVVRGSTLSASLLVSSTRPGPEPANVRIQPLLRSSRWGAVKTPAAATLSVPLGISMLTFTTTVEANRSDYPLNALIVLQEVGKEAKPATLTVSSIALEDSDGADWQVVKSAAIAASIGVVLAVVALVRRLGAKALTTRMGAAGSSLADGWSAALLIGGPFLTTAFTLAGFPDYPPTMSKKMYLAVTFVISVIIGMAPNVYGLYRAPTAVIDPVGKPAIQNQGVSALFLVSALFTLTGCLAQLALLQLFFRDVTAVSLLSGATGRAIDLLLTVLWSAVAVYGPIAAYNTVTSVHASKVAPAVAPAPAKPSNLNVPATPPATPPTAASSLPDWSVL